MCEDGTILFYFSYRYQIEASLIKLALLPKYIEVFSLKLFELVHANSAKLQLCA
jgi:hypothetical protein